MVDIKRVASQLNMTDEQAADVCALFDELPKFDIWFSVPSLNTADDYVKFWEDCWFRSMSFEELVQSEIDQGGWSGNEDEQREAVKEWCEEEMSSTIFNLPCGMYAQYVG